MSTFNRTLQQPSILQRLGIIFSLVVLASTISTSQAGAAAPSTPTKYPATLSLSTTTVPAGEPTSFTAALASTDARADLSGRMVSLQRRNDAGTFVRVASATTDSRGVATMSYTPFSSSVFRAEFVGAASLAAASSAEVAVAVTKAAASIAITGETEFASAGTRTFSVLVTNPETGVPARSATVTWGYTFDDCDRYGCDELYSTATTDATGVVEISHSVYASGTLSVYAAESAATLESTSTLQLTVMKPGLLVELTQSSVLYPDALTASFAVSVSGTAEPLEARMQRYDTLNEIWEDLDSITGLPGTISVELPLRGRYRVIVDESATSSESYSNELSAVVTKFSTAVSLKRVSSTSIKLALLNTTRDTAAGLERSKLVLQRKVGSVWKTYKTVTLGTGATSTVTVPKAQTWRARFAGNATHLSSGSTAVRVGRVVVIADAGKGIR